MAKTSTKIKLIFGLVVAAVIIISSPFFLYLKVLPSAVSNPKVINYVENAAKKYMSIDLLVEEPVLKTGLSPVIDFAVKTIRVTKNNRKLLELDKLDTSVSFAEILKKSLIVNKISSEYIFADVNRLMELMPREEQEPEQETGGWSVDLFDSLLAVKNCEILYTLQPNIHIKVSGKDLEINNAEKVKRFVRFKILTEINKADKHVALAIADDDKVYISNKAIYIDNCGLNINKSKKFINAEAHKNKKYSLEVFSKNFNIQDIVELLQTQIIGIDLNDILAYFSGLKGGFDFNFKLTESGIKGQLKLNKLNVNIVPVDSLPICLTKGIIDVNSSEITIKDFEGYYDNKPSNELSFRGTVKDYYNSIDTEIHSRAIATNDFFKNHLSKLANYPIELTGNGDAYVNINSKYNIIDVKGLFKLDRGVNILVGGEPLPFSKAIRALTTDMHFENMILDINSIKYYMESRNPERDVRRPIFNLTGSVDIAKDNFIRNFGFEIPDPLPSEMLNVLAKQEIFRRGTFAGNLSIDNTGQYPVLKGDLDAEKIIIPSQRTYLREAQLKADDGIIHMSASGKYKRSNYDFTGDILNEIKFPVVVKSIRLSLDYLDVYKLLTGGGSAQQSNEAPVLAAAATDAGTDGVDMGEGSTDFDIGNIIIEECIFSLDKGVYRDINFGNINANLTLNKDSILNIESNKFDIAEGTSTLNVNCDLKKNDYNVRLGIKDVNSDTIASSLLDLNREITGKASGLIILNTDNSLKLNGSIKFLISNGTIQKVGLVEYVMKVAALFRNPLAMISPATFSDLVNMPEGDFNRISGDLILKNNVIEKIEIKSSSPQLSAYIAGRYDLEKKDASMRIYTKFSSYKKGFAGFLRNLSLNSLANHMSASSRNDENYYSAEIGELPDIDADERDCQIFLTKVEGDVEDFNFLSSLNKIR